MSTDDLPYFRQRAAEERERASVASDPGIRAIHLELASKYDAYAGQLNVANDLRSSREVIRRSLDLLAATNPRGH